MRSQTFHDNNPITIYIVILVLVTFVQCQGHHGLSSEATSVLFSDKIASVPAQVPETACDVIRRTIKLNVVWRVGSVVRALDYYYYYYYLLLAYSLVKRSGSPHGFSQVHISHTKYWIQYKTCTLRKRKTYKHYTKGSPFGIALVKIKLGDAGTIDHFGGAFQYQIKKIPDLKEWTKVIAN